MEIVNFFVSNYIWFLGAIIIILLAIIGYVADKTNFGQGKNIDDQIDIESLNSMGIDQLYSRNIEQQEKEQQIPNTLQSENNNLNLQEPDLNNLFEQNNDLDNISTNNVTNDNVNIISNMDLPQPANLTEPTFENKNINVDLSTVLASTQVINDKIDKMKNNVGINAEVETELDDNGNNDFDDEFELLLPKKEIIENDLLSDIDDIELDKTLKYDFSDISNFSNIELPTIKDVNKKNHDLWKF